MSGTYIPSHLLDNLWNFLIQSSYWHPEEEKWSSRNNHVVRVPPTGKIYFCTISLVTENALILPGAISEVSWSHTRCNRS